MLAPSSASQIDKESLSRTVHWLSAPEREGRATGTPGAQAVLGADFKFTPLEHLHVIDRFTADGRDLVSKRVDKVRTEGSQRARDVPAPPLPGMRQEKVWADTHITRAKVHIRYIAQPTTNPGQIALDALAAPAGLVRSTLANPAPMYDSTKPFLQQANTDGDSGEQTTLTVHGNLQVSVATSDGAKPNDSTMYSIGVTRFLDDAVGPLRCAALGGADVDRVRVQGGALDAVLRHLDATGTFNIPRTLYTVADAASVGDMERFTPDYTVLAQVVRRDAPHGLRQFSPLAVGDVVVELGRDTQGRVEPDDAIRVRAHRLENGARIRVPLHDSAHPPCFEHVLAARDLDAYFQGLAARFTPTD